MDNKDIEMEIDTGAAVSIISEQLFQMKFPEQPLDAASVKLTIYTGKVMPVLGQFEAKVSYKQQRAKTSLGLEKKIKHVSEMHEPKSIEEVLKLYTEVF